MALFLGLIAFLLSTLLVGFGLVLLSRSREMVPTLGTREGYNTKEGYTGGLPGIDSRTLVNLAGWLFLVVGLITWFCALYNLFDYWNIGDFETAYPIAARRPF
jgi:hypothetical protein